MFFYRPGHEPTGQNSRTDAPGEEHTQAWGVQKVAQGLPSVRRELASGHRHSGQPRPTGLIHKHADEKQKSYTRRGRVWHKL